FDVKPTVVPDPPRDEKPPEVAPEFTCQFPGCGNELTYGGRGPKPKYCADHKKSKKTSTGSKPRGTAQSEALASQATDLIIGLTDIAAIGFMLVGYHETESEISDAQDDLRGQMYSSLLANPARAKRIITLLGGVTDATLIVALLGFGIRVGSSAVNEYREKKASREGEE
ncbi:MAG TPA: hypothetical protein VJ553_00640, partial [Candidatus Paceibacterota bacterium]|nr:hypothetical protein [Candidatus Paceibacterota bacterium]